ncbi:MAG: hypothetical protein KatS3mg076_2813 [Candidatus Binatia bacterium]|nr:MAG: hypothetical protein KatS3mg076_2813 [Candidatus Binatia bacterium]
MTAIVLGAGVGRRLRELTGGRPKCLLRFGGRSLLRRLLESLGRAGVDRAAVVVGAGADEIRAELRDWAGPPRVFFVENPDYERGAILSLWAAREFFDDAILVMDADVLCPVAMVRRLVESPRENCFLLDGRVRSTGEEQMLMASGGRVLDISRRPEPGYETYGESVGFLKLSRDAARTLRAVLEDEIARGRLDIEHEEAYPRLLRAVPVGYERVDDLPWTEIDFPEDVRRAREEILPLVEALDAREKA